MLDEFYVFNKSVQSSPIPTRLSLVEAAKVDLIQDIVLPKQTEETPLVELSSEKSNLKLSFFSNRKYLKGSDIAKCADDII